MLSLLRKRHSEQTAKIQEIVRNDPRLAAVSGGCTKTCCAIINGIYHCSNSDCETHEN
jgi:hypothetical protein